MLSSHQLESFRGGAEPSHVTLVPKAAVGAAEAAGAPATLCQVLRALQVLLVLLVAKESRAKTEESECPASPVLQVKTGKMACQVRQVRRDPQVRGTLIAGVHLCRWYQGLPGRGFDPESSAAKPSR